MVLRELVVSSPRSPLRCLVVEDQLMIQQLLVGMLQRHPSLELVASAGSAAEGIAACLEHRPDLMILDLALPDGDGITVARALQVIQPAARVIVLSSFATTAERPPELREQIVAILDKSRAYQELIREVEALRPAEAGSDACRLELLTPREREILALIGRGCTSRQIGELLHITRRTVETHRHNICSKLSLSGAALIHQATLMHQLPPIPSGH
jgi:DNA-binding NarL/FixJ family response regulator